MCDRGGLIDYILGAASCSRGGALRGYVGDWLNSVWTEFDRIGLVPAVQ
jgi:hypothetical protein